VGILFILPVISKRVIRVPPSEISLGSPVGLQNFPSFVTGPRVLADATNLR
jgi:hypothetical protein